MCTMVSGLVSGRTVHDFAWGLRLEHFLALNAAEQFSMASMAGFAGGALADAFEALLGALYLDRGYPAARAFLLRLVKVCLFVGLTVRPISCVNALSSPGLGEDFFAEQFNLYPTWNGGFIQDYLIWFCL